MNAGHEGVVYASCHYCGAPATTSDHIVPRARGGINNPINRVPACAPCNSAKGAKKPTCDCRRCLASIAYHAEIWPDGYRKGMRPPPYAYLTPESLKQWPFADLASMM